MSLWDNWEPIERLTHESVNPVSDLQTQGFKNHVSSDGYSCLKFFISGISPKMTIGTLEISLIITEVFESYKTCICLLCSHQKCFRK